MSDQRAAIVTTISVRPAVWRALRLLAERHALQHCGRPSVSGVISELALQHVREVKPVSAAVRRG